MHTRRLPVIVLLVLAVAALPWAGVLASPDFPKPSAATFALQPLQDFGDGWGYYDTLVADVNGDGLDDLVWNSNGQDPDYFNDVRVGLANADGTFDLQPLQNFGEGWGDYRTFIADVNGDGQDDLVWNTLRNGPDDNNFVYVGLSNGNGTFNLRPLQQFGTGWGSYNTFVADVNGDGWDDLVWNSTSAGPDDNNFVFVGLADSNGTFHLQPLQQFGTGWGSYDTFVADVNGDGLDDLVWNSLYVGPDYPNHVFVGLANSDGTFDLQPLQEFGQGWFHYDTFIADVNGDGRDDLVWNSTYQGSGQPDNNFTYVGLANAGGTFTLQPLQQLGSAGWGRFIRRVADVNGDGRDDLVWNSKGQDPHYLNSVYVGLGNPGGTFTLQPRQEFGTGWGYYGTFVADVNGDGRDDLVWNSTSQPTTDNNYVYVALAQAATIYLPLVSR